MSSVTPRDPTRADEPFLDGGLRVSLAEPAPGVLVATVSGELDMATSPHLDARLTDALVIGTHTLLVLDLAKVAFLGVAGVTVLLRHRARADEHFIAFRLVATGRPVLRPLMLLDLHESFDIHPTLADALG